MIRYGYEFIVSIVLTIIIMPIAINIFTKKGFTDKPTKRKKHLQAIPLCGGIVMYFAFMVSYLIFIGVNSAQSLAVFIAASMVMMIGFVDDYYKTKGKEFSIFPRVFVQLLAAYIVYKAGIVFEGITNPIDGSYVILPWFLQFILSLLWMFGVTTVVNWSDGMDGLAGGITAISSSTLLVVALAKGQIESATMSIILLAVIVGFLRFNRHPAKVFMGDSGANFIGFILSIIALDGAFKQATVVSILIPILALGVPIFDNIFVIFKRYTEGKPVYKADRSQIHYRLENKGLNTRQVVVVVCLISSALSLLSLLLLFTNR